MWRRGIRAQRCLDIRRDIPGTSRCWPASLLRVGSAAVFQGIDDGPGSDSIVYDCDRSSGRAITKAGLLAFLAFYVLIVAVTEGFAGVAGLVSRWTAAFTEWGLVTAGAGPNRRR
jgi:hypothetical protein